jgi:hypothetical protein
MTPAAILLQARDDGLDLTATAAGTIKVRGPREAVAAWTPVIVENKAALLAELSSAPSPPTTPAHPWTSCSPRWRARMSGGGIGGGDRSTAGAMAGLKSAAC